MSRELFKYLSDKYQAEIAHLSDDLAKGTARDHGDYKYICGIIRGLMIANNTVMETAERMDSDDD